MLRDESKRVAQERISEMDFAEPLKPMPTQEEILQDVGMVLAVMLGLAAMVSAAVEVGMLG